MTNIVTMTEGEYIALIGQLEMVSSAAGDNERSLVSAGNLIESLKQRIQELEAENEAEILANKMMTKRCEQHEARIAELEAQLAEARKPMRVINVPPSELDLGDSHETQP